MDATIAAAADENDKCSAARPQSSTDSDDDLCDVEFPIIDNRQTSDAWSTSARDIADSGNHSNINVDGSATSMHKMDEDAIIRCFDLSVNAHIKGDNVVGFEPMPPKREVATLAKDVTNEENTPVVTAKHPTESNLRKKWFPAALPLPSWAKNIP